MDEKQKPEETAEQYEGTLSKEDSDKLDADLHGIDMLYRSRCVQTPAGANVTVREVEPKEK